MNVQRVNVLGVGVSAITIPQALDIIDTWIQQGQHHYVCVTGVHGVMESQRDPELRRIHNAAGLVTPDGMPLVWLSRLRGQRHVERVYGPDLMLAACGRFSGPRYRHFLYGSSEDILARLTTNLRKRFPDIQIVGSYAPPYRELSASEDAQIVDLLNQAAPDIIWVGLSTPKQERWMANHVGKLMASALIGVGAAFDFHAGVKKQAPYWMQRSGLEWFFRLMSEPHRLWRRYLINNPLFLGRIVQQMLGLKRYPCDW